MCTIFGTECAPFAGMGSRHAICSTLPMHGAATADFTLAGLVVLVVALLVASPAVRAGDDALAAALAGLDTRSFDAKARAVEAIAATRDPRAAGLLQALLDGRLMRAKADDRFVLADDADGGYAITDALSGAVLGTVGKRKLARLSINNALRTQLRGFIAEAALDNPDAATRRAAVEAMAGHLDGDSRAVLDRLRGSEPDARVRAALDTAIALYDLEQGDDDAQTAAIAVLRGSLDPVARGRLAAIAEDPEAPRALQAAASSALASIENRIATYEFLQMVFFGLSLGSVLVLAAIGLAITFGVMGVINMAHGELIMLGAYTTYVVQLAMPNHLGWSLAVAVPAAFLVAALVGIAIERGVIRFLYGRPLETLLATFGVSLVLQQAVRTIFSPLNRSVATPAWMSGSLELNSVLSLTYNRLYIMAFALIVFAALMAVLRYTRLGLEVRAVAQNRAMARAIGVRGARVDALTFGLGSGVAGVAGVALSQLTNVGPNLGQAYIVDSFMVVVFGGVGNLWGTLVAGLGLGVANKFLEPWAGAVMAKILVLVFIIVFIQKRPRGLFPQRGRAAES